MTEYKTNVMGVVYKVSVGSREELRMSDADQGLTNFYTKEIQVCNEAYGFPPECLAKLVRETMLHELIHAYLYEGGHVRLAESEEVEEWLSVNFDRLVNSIGEFDKKMNKS